MSKPKIINGQTFVRPKYDHVQAGMKWRTNTLVGYFIGKKPYFFGVKKFVLLVWKGLIEVKATSSGFYYFKFSSLELMLDVLEGGPCFYEGQTLFLEKWREGMTLEKKVHREVPAWIKLRHLPAEYWALDGLSMVASAVGRPLYLDGFTINMERIDYARVCVLMNVHDAFPGHIFMLLPSDSGEYNVSVKLMLSTKAGAIGKQGSPGDSFPNEWHETFKGYAWAAK